MKTDDRTTGHRNEVEGDEAKVVRLSDWLAPDDELVPFGPRAHAHPATRDPAAGGGDPHSGVEPPAASGFWDGDPSAHTAVPGPGILDEPGERPADRLRYRRSAPAWRSVRPLNWGSRAREGVGGLFDRLSWRWAAAGVGFVALALIVLVIAVDGGSSGHHEAAAQAGIGESSRAAPSGTLGEIGTAGRAPALSDLRRLPPVDTAGRTIGVAAQHARALAARHRRHTVVATASVPSASTTGSVQTPTIPTPAPAETTSAPAETQPVQTTSNPTSTTASGGSASGGGSGSGSQKHPAFGAAPGSLGPGSSPNG